MEKTIFPEKKIRIMLHSLGISHSPIGNDYIQPNKRYSPYPTSYRNYYQISSCDDWDALVKDGYAKFIDADESFRQYYYVTREGKEYLRSLGYKWHEEEKK